MKLKTCNRCKLAIDTEEERYVKVEDKNGKTLLTKLFFHKECWHQLMIGKEKLSRIQDMAMGVLRKASNKIGGDEIVIA